VVEEAVVDDVAPNVDKEDLVQLISDADKALSESDFERVVQLYTKLIITHNFFPLITTTKKKLCVFQIFLCVFKENFQNLVGSALFRKLCVFQIFLCVINVDSLIFDSKRRLLKNFKK
jgi:hypothetical protein